MADGVLAGRIGVADSQKLGVMLIRFRSTAGRIDLPK
jgi:hypothetical protein